MRADKPPSSGKKATTPLRLEKQLCDKAAALAEVIMPGLSLTRFIEQALYEFIELVEQQPEERQVPDLVKKIDLLKKQASPLALPEVSSEKVGKAWARKVVGYAAGKATSDPHVINERTPPAPLATPSFAGQKEHTTLPGKKGPAK
jgi:hypothetical protein